MSGSLLGRHDCTTSAAVQVVQPLGGFRCCPACSALHPRSARPSPYSCTCSSYPVVPHGQLLNTHHSNTNSHHPPICCSILQAKDAIFEKGQSKRIWGELYKVLDSSDVVIQVLDARDPMGTRCKFIEQHIRKNSRHKHLLLLLNKCDLVSVSSVSQLTSLDLHHTGSVQFRVWCGLCGWHEVGVLCWCGISSG